MTAKEMLENVQELKEQSLFNGFEKNRRNKQIFR